MPRVSEIEEDGGDPILKASFDRQRELYGGLLNPAKVMAHCPPILRAAALLWGPVVLLTVIATGNHFVFDAVAGVAVTTLAFCVTAMARRWPASAAIDRSAT